MDNMLSGDTTEDYTNYKEALNVATTEIRQSKRSNEQKIGMLHKTMTSRVPVHMSGPNKTYETRLDH